MPELNPGLPQVEAQGGIGAVSPNLEAVSEAGRGVERFGNDLAQTGEVFERRNQQSEVSSGYSGVAGLREQGLDDLQESARTGELDVDEYKQQLSDKFGKLEDSLGLQTQVGQNYFNRQQARAQGYLLQKAVHLKAQLTSKQTTSDIKDGATSMSNVAMKDPGQFPDLIDSNEESIQTHIGTGAISAADAPQLRKFTNGQIADGAAKGWAQMDPGKDADGKPNPNLLTQMLAHRDENGKGPFDDYLDADHISQLESYAKTQDSARASDAERGIRLQKEAKTMAAEQWETNNLPKLANNTLSAKSVVDARDTLGFEKAERLLTIIKQHAKEPTPDNDANYIRFMRGINADEGAPGKVYSTDQIWGAAAKKQISVNDANKLQAEFNSSRYAKDLTSEKKQAYEQAQGVIRYKDMTSPLTPQPYAEGGNTSYGGFLREAHALEDQTVKAGGNPRDLYDPANKQGIYSLIDKYRATPQKMQADQAAQIKALAIKKAVLPQGIRAIKPGESISDWKKATGQ